VSSDLRVVRSYCRICAPCCGVLVTVDGETVTAVRGDPDNAHSHGYVCPKGRALGDLHHDPRRLDHPEVRVDGTLVPSTWDATLDDLAGRIRRAIEESGPDAVAVYQGTPALKETAAMPVLNALMRRLGSRSRYSSLTVDISATLTVTTMVLGTTLLPVVDIEEARFLLVLGTNPVVSHGQYNGFVDPIGCVRTIAARGEAWVVDPRRTETAHHARHVAIRPGTDHALLAYLVRDVLRRGPDPTMDRYLDGVDALRNAVEPWGLERAAAVTGIDAATIEELAVGIARAGRIAVVTGTGLTMARSGNVSVWLTWALLLLTGSFDRPGGMWCNPGYLRRVDRGPLRTGLLDDGRPGPASRPDVPRFLAEHPCAALADEIEAGTVRVLVSFGGNPLVAIAEPDRLRKALASLDAYVVVGTVRDAQDRFASHVLPCTGMLERADANVASNAQLEVTSQYTPAVVAPAAERRPAWWIFGRLGGRLDVDVMPGGLDVDTATDDDVLAVVAGGREQLSALQGHDGAVVAEHRVTGWVLDGLPEGTAHLALPVLVDQLAAAAAEDPSPAPLRLVPRRLLRRFNSVHSPVGRQDEQSVLLHPADADAAGVADGAGVKVRSDHGELVGRAVVDDAISVGAVAISHGFADVHVGQLTSTRDIDPLTGMITQTGIAVIVEPA
jgi:anaerobic selenocysteine-containing dehydrogenase